MTPPPSHSELHAHATLAAAVQRGSAEQIAAAARALAEQADATTVHEVLRLLHLFLGFPRIVRALQAVAAEVPAPPEVEKTGDGADQEPSAWRDHGVACFHTLYGERADGVLRHLEELDPLFRDWVVEHAYGRVMARPGLAMADKERLAVLALAATGCWVQWKAHAGNALHLGVPAGCLHADLELGDWLSAEVRTQASQRLRDWLGEPRA